MAPAVAVLTLLALIAALRSVQIQRVELALQRIQDLDVTTSWASAATPGVPSDPLPSDPDWAGGSLYVDERESVISASP